MIERRRRLHRDALSRLSTDRARRSQSSPSRLGCRRRAVRRRTAAVPRPLPHDAHDCAGALDDFRVASSPPNDAIAYASPPLPRCAWATNAARAPASSTPCNSIRTSRCCARSSGSEMLYRLTSLMTLPSSLDNRQHVITTVNAPSAGGRSCCSGTARVRFVVLGGRHRHFLRLV